MAVSTFICSRFNHERLGSIKLRPAARMRLATVPSLISRLVLVVPVFQAEPVHRTGCCVEIKVRQMQVNRGLLEIAMAEQDLNGSQVCSASSR